MGSFAHASHDLPGHGLFVAKKQKPVRFPKSGVDDLVADGLVNGCDPHFYTIVEEGGSLTTSDFHSVISSIA